MNHDLEASGLLPFSMMYSHVVDLGYSDVLIACISSSMFPWEIGQKIRRYPFEKRGSILGHLMLK